MRKILFLISVLLLVAGTSLIFIGKETGGSIIYGSAVITLVFVFLTNFSHFEGFGIKAELLENKINEADDVIRKMKDMSLSMGEMLFSLLARMGRVGVEFSHEEQYKLMSEYEKRLIDIGASTDDIDKAKRDWHKYNIFDIKMNIRASISSVFYKKIDNVNKKISIYPKPINSNDEGWNFLVRERELLHKKIESLDVIFGVNNFKETSISIKNYIENEDLLLGVEKSDILKKNESFFVELDYYLQHHKFINVDEWLISDQKKVLIDFNKNG